MYYQRPTRQRTIHVYTVASTYNCHPTTSHVQRLFNVLHADTHTDRRSQTDRDIQKDRHIAHEYGKIQLVTN